MIRLKNITKSYEKSIMEEFNMDIKDSEITAILGPSGCGKSTLLNILLDLDHDFTGSIEGLDNKKVSVVFQEDRLLNSFSVQDNLKVANNNKEELKKIAKIFELEEFLLKYPYELSGGMKRRVALARAFIYNGNVVIMDEPFKGIDVALKKNIMSRVKELVKEKTCIFITHDASEAVEIADRVIILKGSPIFVFKDLNLRSGNNKIEFIENYLLKMESDL